MHHLTQAERNIVRRQRLLAWWRVNWPLVVIIALVFLALTAMTRRAADLTERVPWKGAISLEGLAVTGEGRAQSH